jgi:hypothetical protein
MPDRYCEDCGLAASDFPLAVVLPDADWALVHPDGAGGFLCAGCIADRAAELPGVQALYLRLVHPHDDEALQVIKNQSLQRLAAPRG